MPKKQQSTATLPPLPREHGAWAMFLVPLVIGLGVGVNRNVLNNSASTGMWILLLWLTALGVFLLRHALMLLLKAHDDKAQGDAIYWSGIYGAIALVGGLGLLIMTQLWGLAIFGALGGAALILYLRLVSQRQEQSVIGEWTAIVGVALSAPSAYITITQSFDVTAGLLYVLNVLFFGGTVYYIKYKVREQSKVTTAVSDRWTRLRAARAPILYTIVVAIIGAVLMFVSWLPWLGWVALLVPLPKVFIGALERPTHVNIQRLGLIEVAHSIVFASLVLWAWRY